MVIQRLLSVLRDYWLSLGKISANARMYLLAAMFMAVALGVQLVLFNLYLLEIGFDEEAVGQIAALIAIGVAVGGLPAGGLYDRWGGKVSFTLATVGILTTLALMAVSIQLATLRIWAFLHGLANAVFFVSIFPYITDQSAREERSHLYGLNLAIWSGFRVVGNLVAGYLPGLWGRLLVGQGEVLPLQASLVSAALLGSLALIPLGRMRRTAGRSSGVSRERFVVSAESRPVIVRIAVVLALYGVVIGLTQPFYNVYFKRVFAADTAVIGILFGLSELTALVSALFVPALVARWGLVVGPALVIGLSSPLTFMIGLPLALSLVAGIFLVRVGLQWLGNAPLMNLVMEVVASEDRGAVSGVRLVTNYGAQSVAGIVGGWLVVRAGYAWLFAAAAAIQLVAGGAIWLFFHPRKAALETTDASIGESP